MSIRIIDNFIAVDDFKEIQNTLLGPWFPWYFNNDIISPEITRSESNNLYNFQFIHTFYKNYAPQSQWVDLINPLIKKLNPLAIFRIKANLNTFKNKNFHYGFHVDNDFEKITSGIYYINTNNGKTVFKDGTEIDAVENRLVLFNSQTEHSGMSCTDQKSRCVINVNIIE
jgi:hypothetical protein